MALPRGRARRRVPPIVTRIAVCLQWVDQAPEVDPLTGAVRTDARTSGLTLADAAALEWARRALDAWGGELVAVTVGPAGADAVLRTALSLGARHAVRVEGPEDGLDASAVARGLAGVLAGADLVWCGDQGAVGGSGAVPALLAHHLGAAPVLGAVEVELAGSGELSAARRLDGGRRERLVATLPAVVSVEGTTARLRRASLADALAAEHQPVDVRAAPVGAVHDVEVRRRPLRPRSRVLGAPVGAESLDRVRQLLGGTGSGPVSSSGGRAAPVVLEPAAAADRILAALQAWGYDLPAIASPAR